MKFSYTRYPTNDPKYHWIRRPLVPIIVYGPKGQWEGLALVDSGADRSLFHIDVGQKIGLRFEKAKLENFIGIEGNPLPVFTQAVKAKIPGQVRIISLQIGFANSPGVSAILGQDGFFDQFTITFNRKDNSFEVN